MCVCVVRYGLECLFFFYSYGLEKNFMQDVYREFEDDTIADYESGKSTSCSFEFLDETLLVG